MERLTINELLDAYDKIMRVTTSGTPLYKRAESAHYYLQQLRHYQKLGVSFDHLRDLLQAERAGQLVVLPCKVGDKALVKDRAGVLREMRLDAPDIRFICTDEDNFCGATCNRKPDGFCAYRIRNDGSDIGKTVFLTREEAEAALALKGGEGNA